MNENSTSNLTPAEVKQANAEFQSWITEGGDQGMTKVAASVDNMIRVRVREGSISRNILKPRKIGAEELVPSLYDDDPRYIGEVEPDTPGSLVTPIAGRPNTFWFFGKRYEVRFSRLHTPRYMKDTEQLLTYKTDLRRVLSDASLKDLLSFEDTRFLQAVNTLLAPNTGAAGETLDATGVIQWDTINDDVNPSSLSDALTVMNRSNFGLDPKTVLVNLNFAKQLMKLGRDDFGGDLAQEVKTKGFGQREFMGVNWLVTIKNWLVPDGVMYQFGPQEFIGETLILTDATMHIRKEGPIIDFGAYQTVASVIENIAAVARVDFTQVAWPEGS